MGNRASPCKCCNSDAGPEFEKKKKVACANTWGLKSEYLLPGGVSHNASDLGTDDTKDYIYPSASTMTPYS